jgi:homeobox protein ESX1
MKQPIPPKTNPSKPDAQPPAVPQPAAQQPAAADAKPRPVEIGGPSGPEPTRYGDWERNGRVSDF